MRRLSALALGALLGLLAACGGGGGDVPAPPTALPDTAVPDAVAPVVPGPGPVIPVVVPPDAPAPGGSAECSDSNQRAWLQTYMQDQYFWNQPLRAPLATAPDLNAYFRSMLNLPLDRYSYTQRAQAFEQLYAEGTRTGYGYTLVWTDIAQTQLRVRQAERRTDVGEKRRTKGQRRRDA